MRISLILLAIIGLAACENNSNEASFDSGSFEFEEFSKTWYAPFCAEDSTSCAKIEAVFPFIANEPSGSGKIINDSIFNFIKTMIGGFEMDQEAIASKPLPNLVVRFFNEYKSFTEEFADFSLPWVIEIRGKLLYNSSNIVSIELADYSFTGGAHPNYAVQLINFDVKTGKILTIEDFISDFDALKLLAEEQFRLARKMKKAERLEDAGFMFGDSFTLPANFALSKDGLYFFYNPYEAGAYVLGTTDFTIPFEDLEGIIKFL